MTDRLLVDLDTATTNWPLGAAELEDLRWYLEDYLRAPYGVYETRGSRIAELLPTWGQAMFTALFGSGPARDAYIAFRTRATSELEIVLRSARPERLGMPWELLRDPHLAKPLALDGVGFSRTLPGQHRDEPVAVQGRKLRVLMVIARPRGAMDVGYQMIARPLLRRLAAVRGPVELEVLRPPTLEALDSALRSAREPFQIVHFDGHGELAGDQGVLHFEGRSVPAERVAQVLNVPVVVLNACQSGALGKQLEAAVATQLLAGGAQAVVAMAYNVYAVAAAEFMTAFYEHLFAGDTVGDAVRAGRIRLAQRPGRPSPKGELPLADWAVPVHYARAEVRFPQLRTGPATPQPRQDDALAPAEEFVGRDSLFYALETAPSRVIVLHGPAGTGKTELAKAFGRWWRDTGGVDQPEHVLWHSSEPGVHEPLPELPRTDRFLLILDNLPSDRTELKRLLDEAAGGASMVLLTSRNKEDWLGGVHRIAVGGLTRDEAIEYADQLLAPVPAAGPRRADPTFGELLEWLHGHPLSMRTILPHLETTDAATLLASLRGTTPLPEDDRLTASITYSITHLDPADRRLLPAVGLFDSFVVAEMLSVLSKIRTAPQRFQNVDSDKWTAVLDRAAHVGLLTTLGNGIYSIHPALPAYLASLWRAEDPEERATAERALLDAYAAFAAMLHDQSRASDYQVIGLHRRTMVQLLGYAVENQLWGQAGPLFLALKGFWDRRGLTEEVRTWVDRIMQALNAVEHSLGEVSGRLWLLLVDTRVQDLINAWQLDAAEALCTEALDLLLARPQEPTERDSCASIYSRLGRVAQLRGRQDEAEQWLRKALTIYEDLGERRGIARSLTELGSVARTWARWDEAERWLTRSLALREELGDLRGMALTTDQLGDTAQARGRWDDAEGWYRKSLDVMASLGDLDGRGRAYHELGMVSMRRGRFDAAARWFHESLGIAEKLNDPRARAAAYHQIGMVAHVRGQFDEAEQWYRQSLAIKEELRDRSGIASSHQSLGALALNRKQLDEVARNVRQAIDIWTELGDQRNVAGSYLLLAQAMQDHGRLDEAERCYRSAIAIQETLDDRVALSVAYGQLGRLAGDRGDADGALEYTIRSVALFEQSPDPRTSPAHHQLAQLTIRFGMEAIERHWADLTGDPLPPRVRDLIEPQVQGGQLSQPGNQVSRSARIAARQLAPERGAELETQVEAVIYARSSNQYFDPISLGSLIVSVATLAWTVYNDLRGKTPKPPRETITERVRADLPANDHDPADLDKIIDIIVDDIIKDPED